MIKRTHKEISIRCLVLILISLSLIGTFSHQLAFEQNTLASPIAAQNQNVAVAAIVKAEQANLRDTPGISGRVVRTLTQGDLLALINPTPVGPWYRVRDPKSDAEGWIHGNTIALLVTTEVVPISPATVQRPRRTLPPISGRSYINVDGIGVPSPVFSETKPAGSSARCRDGSYSFSQHRRGTCSYHGGVAEWY
jgi:Protein of unknown function (DUF3761)/Bacterial SH3 domain